MWRSGEKPMERASETKRGRRRTGQAVVEFALVLPVFMLLVFGAIEFGRAYYSVHLLTTAARKGARVGSLKEQTDATVGAAVDEFLEAASLPGEWTTSVSVLDAGGSPREGGLPAALEGDRVFVTVSYDFDVLTGSLIPGFQGTVQLQQRCVFRHE
jgi:Flp pilus assembly protein TadG